MVLNDSETEEQKRKTRGKKIVLIAVHEENIEKLKEFFRNERKVSYLQ